MPQIGPIIVSPFDQRSTAQGAECVSGIRGGFPIGGGEATAFGCLSAWVDTVPIATVF